MDCCGIEGFIPVSHLAEEGRGSTPRDWSTIPSAPRSSKGPRKRRIVLSRRALLENELMEEKRSFFEKTEAGQTLEGTVTSITSFGPSSTWGPLKACAQHGAHLGRNVKPKEIVNKGDGNGQDHRYDPENTRVS